MSLESKTDFLGNELKIGDKAAYATQGYVSLNVGFVTEFTKSKIRINREFKEGEGHCYFPYQAVKVFGDRDD